MNKLKLERINELFAIVNKQKKIEFQIEQIEEEFSYRYNIKNDDDYERLVELDSFKIKYSNFFDKKKEWKYLIEQRIKLEQNFFNLSKGVYIGLGVDLMNIKVSMSKEPIYIPWSHLDNHMEVLGTTRYGKTYFLALIMYQMILKGWNIIAVDPKGGKKQEVLSWMIQFAQDAGRHEDIMFYNPAYNSLSEKLNPIFSSGNTEISSLSSLLAGGDNARTDPFYPSVAFLVTMGILTSLEYLEYVFDYDGSKVMKAIDYEVQRYHQAVNMRNHKLKSYDPLTKIASPDAAIRMFAKSEYKLDDKNPMLLPFNRTLVTFKELAHYSNSKNLYNLFHVVKNTPPPDKSFFSDESRFYKMNKAREEALIVLQTIAELGEFYNKISMSIVALFTKLSIGEVGEMFTSVKINPLVNRLRHSNKKILAIVQPSPLRFETTSEMLNKVFIKMFQSLFGQIGVTGRSIESRVACLFDEAGKVLFPGIDDIYNKAGGMGMTLITFMQSIQDRIAKVGPVVSQQIGDNTNTHVYLKVNNLMSKEEIVRDFGTKMVHERTILGQEMATRISVTTTEKYLINTNDIDQLSKGQAFVSSYGKKYLVSFPHILPPSAEIVMPEIEEERVYKDINSKVDNIDFGMLDANTHSQLLKINNLVQQYQHGD